MESIIKLTYFNDGKGRSELPRLCLKCGGIDFEDERIHHGEYKRRRAAGELPFGQLPTLQVGDTILAQSCAISKWCASRAGLVPKNDDDNLKAAQADMVMDAWRDLHDEFYAIVFARIVVDGELVMTPTPREGRKQAVEDLFATTATLCFSHFERMLRRREGSSSVLPFLVCDSLSVADLALFDAASMLQSSRLPDDWDAFMDSFPEISGLLRRIGALPWMVEHLKEMPYRNLFSMIYAQQC